MSCRLTELLSSHSYRQIPRDYSGLEVYFLPELFAYLKIGTVDRNSNLRWERDVLEWLNGKVSVPRVIDFEISDGYEYILISELEGLPYSDQIVAETNVSDIENLVELVAAHARMLHDLPISDCPLDQCLTAKFKKAEENIKGGFVDESDFDRENLGKTGQQIFDELRAYPPPDEDLVFTHGDLCLPNIIIKDSGPPGFIDFDHGGIADRYQDIALFLRSFDFNNTVSVNVEAAFCRGYGIGELDRRRMDFYRKLDELF